MVDETEQQTTAAERKPRTYRPLPVEQEAAHKRLAPGQTMNDVIRAALRWFASDPDAPEILERYMPDDAHGGRPRGARDSRPRQLRGGGSWWAVWTPDGATLYNLVPGPAGLAPGDAHEALRIYPAFVLEQCDAERAGELAGWERKGLEEQAALRPARERLVRVSASA